MRKNPLPALLAIVSMAFVTITFAGSAGASTPPPATGEVKVLNQVYEVPAALAARINSQDWSGLTAEDLAQAHIYPGMGDQAEAGPVAGTTDVVTDSASGCNKNVCIYVYGKGYYVEQWNTRGYGPKGMLCTYAAYWHRGVITATSNSLCGANANFVSTWAYKGTYNAKTQLCNTWVGIAGKPCETVHK